MRRGDLNLENIRVETVAADFDADLEAFRNAVQLARAPDNGALADWVGPERFRQAGVDDGGSRASVDLSKAFDGSAMAAAYLDCERRSVHKHRIDALPRLRDKPIVGRHAVTTSRLSGGGAA
jgi:hypothetical protein